MEGQEPEVQSEIKTGPNEEVLGYQLGPFLQHSYGHFHVKMERNFSK